MTKSAKRKKEKNADFTKRKLKLGKGKQPAANAIDTSFKARSIALPQQSITVTKETSAPTTKRKLTLDTLLTHLKHYGAGVRKDALQGLHELLSEHHDLIKLNLSRLVSSCVRLISDEDPSVRKALHSFLAWFLPRIPREHLIPYAPTLLLFTASAQSHIFPEIRLDAVRILDLLLELIPEQVVAGIWSEGSGGNQGDHGRKILDGYLGLLNISTRFGEGEDKSVGQSSGIGGQSSTAVTLSAASKAIVLRSFSKFLYHATTTVEQRSAVNSGQGHRSVEPIPLWYLSGSFNSQEAFTSFADMLSLQRSIGQSQRQAHEWFGPDDDDFVGRFPLIDIHDNQDPTNNLLLLSSENILAEIDRLGNNESATDGFDVTMCRLLASLCRTVHPVLISTFLDVAPSVFSPTQPCPETDLDLLLSLMEIARCLHGRLLRDVNATPGHKAAARDELASVVTHMSPYFPFGENRMFPLDMKSESTFQEMNLIYCELFSLQSLNYASDSDYRVESHGPLTKRRKLDHPNLKKNSTVMKLGIGAAKQTDRVREYVIRSLRGVPSQGGSANSHPLGRSLTAQTYAALLPTIWWLLVRQDDEEDSSEVLEAVLYHATKAGSLSGVKLPATEFVARLVLLQNEPSYRGTFRMGHSLSHEMQKALRDWLCHLPKVLWELSDKNPAATELILLFMLRLAQRRSWLNNDTSIALCTRFAPFFTMQHATRGELRGPYSRLDNSPVEANAFLTHPNNINGNGEEKHFGRALLKKLALDVAAVLATQGSNLHDNNRGGKSSTPRKIFSKPGRRPESDTSAAKSDSDPALKVGSSAEARAGLRRAVEKAVSGTTEEMYWYGVSHM